MKNQVGKRREENSDRHWQRTAEAYGSASEQKGATRAHPNGRQTPALLNIHFYTRVHINEHERRTNCCIAQVSSLRASFYQ